MLLTIIILLVLLMSSLSLNYLLFKAGQRQLELVELYDSWVSEFKQDVQSTFDNIKEIDQKQMFEKDDDVGVIFQQIFELIDRLNKRTHNLSETEEETEEEK